MLKRIKTIKPLNFLLPGVPLAILGSLLGWNAIF